MRPSNRPKVADENARREIPFKSLSTRTTSRPRTKPTSKPGRVRSSSSDEMDAPMTPQKVTNSTRRRLTVKSGVIFQGELRRFGCEGDGPALAAESR